MFKINLYKQRLRKMQKIQILLTNKLRIISMKKKNLNLFIKIKNKQAKKILMQFSNKKIQKNKET